MHIFLREYKWSIRSLGESSIPELQCGIPQCDKNPPIPVVWCHYLSITLFGQTQRKHSCGTGQFCADG